MNNHALDELINARLDAIEKLRGRRFGNKEYDEGVRALFSERDAYMEKYQQMEERIYALEAELDAAKKSMALISFEINKNPERPDTKFIQSLVDGVCK